ncbi:hypothetical protein SAMN04488128_1011868 [Chitinophaga eiseniae]|uniref:Uncharacterized protein n=1 Tax=Chitinophaga eiseniae TaxID=634771 RepID=A0A1T4P2B1_9BACT|nr:hypothetical protein [Chitinophaga eiseniae]SJZ85542.1 hypothetical protein SAMN04488128_1011868 [Chitinophaga eiseniae]
MTTCNWIWKDRLPALLPALSHICQYAFDTSDQEAISYGLTLTSLDNNLWFDYSLIGKQTIALRLCQDDDDTDIVHCQIDHPEEHQPAVGMTFFFLENFELRYQR